MIIKPLASEVNLSATASDIGLASVVRVINTGTTAAGLITIQNADASTASTITLAANESAIIEKDATQTLAGASTLKAVKVAFTN